MMSNVMERLKQLESEVAKLGARGIATDAIKEIERLKKQREFLFNHLDSRDVMPEDWDEFRSIAVEVEQVCE